MNKKLVIIPIVLIILAVVLVLGYIITKNNNLSKAQQILKEYISYIKEEKYEEMYEMITPKSKEAISKEDFVKRNKNIYDGIEAKNIEINIEETTSEVDSSSILYKLSMNTIAGDISYNYNMEIENGYINWSSNLIFPNLSDEDKVRVKTLSAKRGEILDRNGIGLATEGQVSQVGLVPGKMSENKSQDIEKLATLLDISVKSIENALGASYVKEDTFVPLKKVSKDSTELKNNLLEIKGVLINNSDSRVYPYSDSIAHLTGYVQGVSQEDLEKNSDKGYDESSIIGKIGLEKEWEERLRAKNGSEIYIEDKEGNKKETAAIKEAKDGENIKLTIDITIQNKLYEQLKNDKGLFVVMKPKTGELLALVSTPSYNPNGFVLGMSQSKWDSINTNGNKPMLTRYLEKWCPGSTFKPITGAIGLTSGKLSVNDEFKYSGLSWQKDSSWGTYNITTLTSYSGAKNLKNAIIISDNIYFAQAALKIGNKDFENGLKKIGFGEKLDFVLSLSKSQFSNTESIEQETKLADSGYGQGEILVNPIHMAAIYSSFSNDGNMVKPYLEYNNGKQEIWKEAVFSKEAASIIKEDLVQVVESSQGTANDAKMQGVTMAGKTGTAELKASREESGETISWFNCFTDDVLVIGMCENARDKGGSHYIIPMIKAIF